MTLPQTNLSTRSFQFVYLQFVSRTGLTNGCFTLKAILALHRFSSFLGSQSINPWRQTLSPKYIYIYIHEGHGQLKGSTDFSTKNNNLNKSDHVEIDRYTVVFPNPNQHFWVHSGYRSHLSRGLCPGSSRWLKDGGHHNPSVTAAVHQGLWSTHLFLWENLQENLCNHRIIDG